MTQTPSLFGDEPESPASQTDGPLPISDWLVDKLRQALDAEGLTSMVERRTRIEGAAGRPVSSLRALTYQEGVRVLSSITQDASVRDGAKSAWDDREDDTWIDRL